MALETGGKKYAMVESLATLNCGIVGKKNVPSELADLGKEISRQC